jgi:hypothetical protein
MQVVEVVAHITALVEQVAAVVVEQEQGLLLRQLEELQIQAVAPAPLDTMAEEQQQQQAGPA